jgi:transcriptional regulator with XRE-family HTH domain
LKRKAVADAIGISLQPFTSWSKRGSIPSADIAFKIAKYFNVSVEWLLTGEDPDGLSDDDRHLLDDWHELDATTQAIIRPMITTAAENARKDKINIAK